MGKGIRDRSVLSEPPVCQGAGLGPSSAHFIRQSGGRERERENEREEGRLNVVFVVSEQRHVEKMFRHF